MNNTTRQNDHMAEGKAHGCCGGSHKQAAQPVKEDKKETGCGCADKQTKPVNTKSSCCG